ncbi:MAG: DUF255 domain-containing protein [Planctomycetota bacterium]
MHCPKKIAQLAILTILWIPCTLAKAQDVQRINWAPDLAAARKASAEFRVPMMIHFNSDQCTRCDYVEQRVYVQPELIKTLNKYFICVQVNGTKNPHLAAQYGVHSWPTDVFLSASGQLLFQGTSPRDLDSYLRQLQNVAIMNRDSNNLIAQQGLPSSPSPGMNNPATSSTNPVGSVASFPSGGLGSDPASTPSSLAHGSNGMANAQMQGQAFQNRAQLESGYSRMGASIPPTTGVAAGPTTFQNQAQAIAGPGVVQNRIAPNAAFGEQPQGQLPARNQVGQLGTNAVVHPNNLPSMPDIAGAPSVSQPNTSNFGTKASLPAKTIENPYARQNSTENGMPAYPPLPSGSPNAGGVIANASHGVTARQVSASNNTVSSENIVSSDKWAKPASAKTLVDCLEGHCPVTLTRHGQWVLGKKEFQVKHRGQTYSLSSEAARKEFLAAPDAHSPVLSGYDPLIMLEQGKLVPGSVLYGLREQGSGSFLLFSSSENKQRYWDGFSRYSKALSALIQKAHQ